MCVCGCVYVCYICVYMILNQQLSRNAYAVTVALVSAHRVRRTMDVVVVHRKECSASPSR